MASRGQLAKRALVKVLLALAAVYGLVVNVSRDSADDALPRLSAWLPLAPVAFARSVGRWSTRRGRPRALEI